MWFTRNRVNCDRGVRGAALDALGAQRKRSWDEGRVKHRVGAVSPTGKLLVPAKALATT